MLIAGAKIVCFRRNPQHQYAIELMQQVAQQENLCLSLYLSVLGFINGKYDNI